MTLLGVKYVSLQIITHGFKQAARNNQPPIIPDKIVILGEFSNTCG